jgi:metallo-beta-lactamase family protein
MKITLLGAAGGEVTGSAYLVQTEATNVMVDCGLFEGSQKIENFNRLPTVDALKHLHAVVLTHAHLDHTGRLPLLTRFDYKAPIYATQASIALAELILKDSAYLQGEDAKRQNRRRSEAGKPLIEPLYTQKEVDRLHPLYRPLRYDHPTVVAPGLSVRAVEAGHILGSTSLELTVEEAGRKKIVVFSGDIGPRGAPLHRDPVPFKHADLVFMESTHGDKDHPSLAETAVAAREAVKITIEQRGRVLVPTFAIGRSQLLLYLLAGAFKRGTLKPFEIFLDSPMAIRATDIYRTHEELFDEEAIAMRRSGELSKNLRTAQICQKAKDSMALVRKPGPSMVLAGAGMCTGGRIMNHLTKPSVRSVDARADGRLSVARIGWPCARGRREGRTYRGQEDQRAGEDASFQWPQRTRGTEGLLNWFGSLASSRPRVILTHGEDGPRRTLAARIQERFGLSSEVPAYREAIEF